jgi:hypothetical protein
MLIDFRPPETKPAIDDGTVPDVAAEIVLSKQVMGIEEAPAV